MVAATQRTIKPVPVLDKPYWQEYHEPWPVGSADENDVRAIVLDKAGQPWVATKDGPRVLVRAAWVKPDGADAVGSSHSICIDGSGTVWVGATSGLWMISGGKVQPALGFAQVPIGAVTAKGSLIVAAGPDGVFWNKGGKWTKLPGRTMQNVRTVYLAADGSIWVGTASGLYILDPSGRKPVVRWGRPDVLLSSNVHDIRALRNGDVAVASCVRWLRMRMAEFGYQVALVWSALMVTVSGCVTRGDGCSPMMRGGWLSGRMALHGSRRRAAWMRFAARK